MMILLKRFVPLMVICLSVMLACSELDRFEDGNSDINEEENNTAMCANECNVNSAISSEYHAAIHPDLVGSYTLIYDEVQEGAPFAGGDQATFTIGADGSFLFEYNDECVSIDKALKDNNTDVEIRYRDNCIFKVWFIVSDNESGSMHEVNVLHDTSLQLLGQFHL